MTDRYILDADDKPQPCEDLFEWGRWMQTAHRHVAQDVDEGPDGVKIRISTVFLGLDHGFGQHFGADRSTPVLWETLVFGGPLDGEMDRYTSTDEALRGHQAMCARVTAALKALT